MRVKNEHEIKALAKESAGEPLPDKDLIAQWKCYVGGYEKGYTQAQQDLLSQASEGFEEKFGEEPKDGDSWDWANRKVGWQAAILSQAKENEALKKESEELEHLSREAEFDLIFLVEELRPRVSGSFWDEKFRTIIKKHKLEHYFGEAK